MVSMKWFWFPIAVLATSVVSIAALAVLVGRPVGIAVASSLGASGVMGSGPWSGAWHNGPWGHGSGFALPPELQGLTSIPADQRFSHFASAQINLKDQNGQLLTIDVTPGTVSAASATSLTLAVNDGTTKTFTLDSSTLIHGRPTSAGTATPTASTKPQKGDQVVVVTLNKSTTAMAVIAGGPNGFSWSGPRGPWGMAATAH
jgi:hypothetical protein